MLDNGTACYGFEITGDRGEEYRVKKEWGSLNISGEATIFSIDAGEWKGPENLRPSIDNQSLAITSFGGDERIKPLWEFLANMMVYAIYPDVLREPQKYSNETPMQPRGENWVSILYQQDKDGWKPDLVSALEKLTCDIDDIKVAKASGFLITQFHHKARGEKVKKWFGADLESDGTLRVAGLLTALLQKPALTIIGIEAPELTVHPGALPIIYDYLSEASDRSQIFVTTHSPILRDEDDSCPKELAPIIAGSLLYMDLPFPVAYVLSHPEYEVLFLPCLEQMTGQFPDGRPGLMPDTRWDRSSWETRQV